MASAGGALRAPVASIALAVTYSFEVVGVTTLTVRLAPGSEGSAIGFMNGAIAAGAIGGAIVPSFVAKAYGYDALPVLASGTLVLALLVGLPIFRLGRTAGAARPATSVSDVATS